MSLLKKKYELVNPDEKPIDTDFYFRKAKEEYISILSCDYQEKVYQKFFEENPAFLPGAYEIVGNATGHAPYMNALISQPIIDDCIQRKPDFMWLAKDSLCFCPVLIEIERPSKEEFRKDEYARSGFTQAVGQIKQWKAILNSTNGREQFYERYSIPQNLRALKFTPQYLLVFGRRSEYEEDKWLTRLRAEEESSDTKIFSFDRLMEPSRDIYDTVTCKVSDGNYHVISIPPTFVYRPGLSNNYDKLINFKQAVTKMIYTSDGRKQFLLNRYSYWVGFGESANLGSIDTSDKE